MRKSILLGAVSVVGLTLAAIAPLAGQAPGRGTPGNGPAVAAPGPGQNDPAIGRGGRRGVEGGRFGGRPGGGPGNGRGVARGRTAEALGLTDDQKAATAQLRLKSRDEIAPLVDRLRLARRELHRAVFADQADAAATKKLSAEVAALGQQIEQKRLESQKAFAALLTADQRLKLRAGVGGPEAGGRGRRGGPRNAFGATADPGPAASLVR